MLRLALLSDFCPDQLQKCHGRQDSRNTNPREDSPRNGINDQSTGQELPRYLLCKGSFQDDPPPEERIHSLKINFSGSLLALQSNFVPGRRSGCLGGPESQISYSFFLEP